MFAKSILPAFSNFLLFESFKNLHIIYEIQS